MPRTLRHRTRGHGHGPIVRLMSPGDLGEIAKPFVFLDLFRLSLHGRGAGMPLHPHSGIATVTVFTEGDVTFDDPDAGHGTLGYGGVEWARAGRGMWHGQELSGGTSAITQGFQLWIALPPELEGAPSESQYLPASAIPSVGPARLIVGAYDGASSPVRAPSGLVYLLVTLAPGQRWTFTPPKAHRVLWLAVARGAVSGDEALRAGDLGVFHEGDGPCEVVGDATHGATFVLGSAVPHPHPLHLGRYSVHTSAAALADGEAHIVALQRRLEAAGDRRTASGSTPVFRG